MATFSAACVAVAFSSLELILVAYFEEMRFLQIQYERTKLCNRVLPVNINAVTKDFVKSSWKADLYCPRVAHLRTSRSAQEVLTEKLW